MGSIKKFIIFSLAVLAFSLKLDAGQAVLSNSAGFQISADSSGGGLINTNGTFGFTISSQTASAEPVPSTGNYGDLLSINLNAGNYIILGNIQFGFSVNTTQFCVTGVDVTSGNNPPSAGGINRADIYPSTSAANIGYPMFVQVSPSSNTSYYLKMRCNYTSGTPTATGSLFSIETH